MTNVVLEIAICLYWIIKDECWWRKLSLYRRVEKSRWRAWQLRDNIESLDTLLVSPTTNIELISGLNTRWGSYWKLIELLCQGDGLCLLSVSTVNTDWSECSLNSNWSFTMLILMFPLCQKIINQWELNSAPRHTIHSNPIVPTLYYQVLSVISQMNYRVLFLISPRRDFKSFWNQISNVFSAS